MLFFLSLTIEGALAGALYALIALAFVVVYKASRVINFALGEWQMLATLLGYRLRRHVRVRLSFQLAGVTASSWAAAHIITHGHAWRRRAHSRGGPIGLRQRPRGHSAPDPFRAARRKSSAYSGRKSWSLHSLRH